MKLDLQIVAAELEGLEETIISKLIDRAQFKANAPVYEPGKSGFDGKPEQSLLDIRLRHQEEMDAVFGRFSVPEERPFVAGLPESKRNFAFGETGLFLKDDRSVNLTKAIRSDYEDLLPKICADGDDRQYGSSVEHDVMALQAVSRRVHYGSLYVAECKFQEDTEGYSSMLAKGDEAAIMEKLTRKDVEERILERVREKVAYLQARVNQRVRSCLDPEVVLQFYRDSIIPLTKKGEVLYLRSRKPS